MAIRAPTDMTASPSRSKASLASDNEGTSEVTALAPATRRGVGRPRLSTPERGRRRLEVSRAWIARNRERKRAIDTAYRARPGHYEQRRLRYASKRGSAYVPRGIRALLPDDVGTPAQVRARHRCRRCREKRRRATREGHGNGAGCVQPVVGVIER